MFIHILFTKISFLQAKLCRALSLQMTEATANILSSHGFILEKRGSVTVKGKGELTTFFVISEPKK